MMGGEDGWPAHHARVYQATGMVSAQRGVGLEASLALLRAYAFAHDQALGEVAAAVVARRLRLDSAIPDSRQARTRRHRPPAQAQSYG